MEGQYKVPGAGNDGNNNNDDNDNDDDGDNTSAPVENQGVKDSVPKTDDSTISVLPFAAAGAVCAAAAVVLKKKEQR